MQKSTDTAVTATAGASPTLSYEQLRGKGACAAGLAFFEERWGRGPAGAPLAAIAAALAEHPPGPDWWEWLRGVGLLPAAVAAEYKRVRQDARSAYTRVRQDAWATYQRDEQDWLTTRSAYERVGQDAWAKYQRVWQDAWATYQRDVRDWLSTRSAGDVSGHDIALDVPDDIATGSGAKSMRDVPAGIDPETGEILSQAAVEGEYTEDAEATDALTPDATPSFARADKEALAARRDAQNRRLGAVAAATGKSHQDLLDWITRRAGVWDRLHLDSREQALVKLEMAAAYAAKRTEEIL